MQVVRHDSRASMSVFDDLEGVLDVEERYELNRDCNALRNTGSSFSHVQLSNWLADTP